MSAAPATAISSVPKSLSLLSRRSGGERPRCAFGQTNRPRSSWRGGWRADGLRFDSCWTAGGMLRRRHVRTRAFTRGSGGGDGTRSENQRQEPRAMPDRSHNRCKRAAVLRFPSRGGPVLVRCHRTSHFRIGRTLKSPEETTLPRIMRPTRTLFLPIALAAAASAAAQRSPNTGGGSSIPTPESVFGFPVGEDYKLFTYDQSIDYFKKLAAASNRVQLINVGKTSFGKPWTAAIISSPANLARLDKLREINMTPRAPRRAHRRRGARPRARRGAPSSTSAAACTRRRSRVRSTRRRSRTSCCRARTSPR